MSNNLKEYHIFSFTNYNGFKKAVRILERNKRYKNKKISGRIVFILDYLNNEIAYIRKLATFEGLKEWFNHGNIIGSSEKIYDWERFQELVKMLEKEIEKGQKIDMFGEFKIDLR